METAIFQDSKTCHTAEPCQLQCIRGKASFILLDSRRQHGWSTFHGHPAGGGENSTGFASGHPPSGVFGAGGAELFANQS